MRFRVWAPEASRVVAEVDGRAHELRRDPDPPADGDGPRGWWSVEVADAEPGSRYWYAIDDGPPRPDPRSPSQPDGVDGPAAVDDPDRFPWTDQAWSGFDLRTAVLYELHLGTFSAAGTCDGAIAHLDALVDLGVDAVEVMPVAEFAGDRGWGYDGVDLYAPHHAYGGPDGFRRFVDACHGRGLGVVLDVVYNHLGPAGNHTGAFGPYFTERHVTNWGQGVNVDGPRSDEVRDWIIANARHWFVDHHVDGLRLDAVHAIADDSAVHVLEALAAETRRLEAEVARPLWLVAESDRNDPRYVRPVDAGGYGLDAAWADEWHHALHAALTGERDGYYEDFGSLDDLVLALRQAWVYADRYSPHRQRHHGRSPAGLPAHAFVVSAQNHDQVGNRARGERLGHLVSPGRLRIAAALLLTSPFTPMLFQGEEWDASTPFLYFTDHEPELGRAVTEGRRAEFAHFEGFADDPDAIPDPQDADTFRRSVLRWEERDEAGHRELLDWYRRLIGLRKSQPALLDDDPTSVEVAVDGGLLVQHRGRVTVAANLGAAAASLPVTGDVVLAHAATVDRDSIEIAPDGVVVVLSAG